MRGAIAVVAVVALLAPGGAALAQPTDVAIRGSVTGDLARDREVRFNVTASHPEGWASLATVGASLQLRGAELETLTFEPADDKLTNGTASVLAGTGDRLEGSFFEVSGTGIALTTGGTRMTLRFAARVLADVPAGARFRFTAVDRDDAEVSTSLRAPVPPPEEGGFPLSTLIVAAVAALAAGSLLGSRVTSSRRSRTSVYGSVARRLAERPPGDA